MSQHQWVSWPQDGQREPRESSIQHPWIECAEFSEDQRDRHQTQEQQLQLQVRRPREDLPLIHHLKNQSDSRTYDGLVIRNPLHFAWQQHPMVIDTSGHQKGDNGTSEQHLSQRSVRFSPVLSIHSNCVDAEDNLLKCWYSKGELKNFKCERKTIIRMLKKVNFDPSQIDTSIFDLRGLEAYSSVSS
jgi:hypothetical protein